MTSQVTSKKWWLGAGAGVLLLAVGAAFGPIPGFENEDEAPFPASDPGMSVEQVLQIATDEHPDGDPVGVELENEDGLVYGVEFSDGFEVEMDADSGEIIETEQEDEEAEDGETSATVEVPELTFADARDAALAVDGNTDEDVMGIELENENGQLAYSVELSNGSEVELDANTGDVLEVETDEDDGDEDEE